MKILQTKTMPTEESPPQTLQPGQFALFGDDICAQTGDSFLSITKIQLSGKRAMLPKEFANGIRGKQLKDSELMFGQ